MASCNTYGFYTTSINSSNAKQFVQEAILIGGPGVIIGIILF